jgi:hypothetical protein
MSTPTPTQALVIGGSLAGLVTARVLADHVDHPREAGRARADRPVQGLRAARRHTASSSQGSLRPPSSWMSSEAMLSPTRSPR